MTNEREIIKDFIKLYSDFPCLWDVSSDLYKDKNQKEQAWNFLVEKIRQLEPGANLATAKKKVEHMRSAYKRETRKVTESKRPGSGAKVHVPNLWYFDLLSFLDKKDVHCRSGVKTPTINEESQTSEQACAEGSSGARKRCASDRELNNKKRRLIDTAQELLQLEHNAKRNSFAVYMGEQLQQVSPYQRQVAEKIISEVIFLAKTENLHFDSKVETPSRSRNFSSSGNYSYSQSHSPKIIQPYSSPDLIQSAPSPQIMQPAASPQYVLSTPLPQFAQPSPSHQFIQPSPSSYHKLTEEKDSHYEATVNEGSIKSILKKMLIDMEPK